MSKLVVIAVVVLAAVATADVFRASPRERALSASLPPQDKLVVHHASSGLVAVGSPTRTRVLWNGHEYLSAERVEAALPEGFEGRAFDVAYVAGAADGTVALGIHAFPQRSTAAIELWRNGELLSAFRVPAGALAGGLGFADEGRYVAALSRDGLAVYLFRRNGRPAGTASATSW